MYDLRKKGHFTVYRLIKATYNKISNSDMFTLRSLTSPPSHAWIKKVTPSYPNADELVRKADHLLRGEISSKHYVDFDVYRPGQIIRRKMIIYLRKRKFGLSQFVAPLRDRNTTILKRGYDLWMYTPRIRKTIRIPFAMMHEGILGSDFTYDDIIKEATLADDYSHKIIGVSRKMSKIYGKVYVVDLYPLPGRPITYKKYESNSLIKFSARYTWQTGLLILLFLILHLITFWYEFKFGTPHRELYDIVVAWFHNPLYSLLYILFLITLGVHIHHGFQSAFQTFGWNHPKYTPWVEKFSTFLAWLFGLGFSLIPLYFYFTSIGGK